MIPGPDKIIKCPKCHWPKSLITVLSANTIGRQLWSDNYCFAPMFPQLSPIQKCEHCNHYFLLSRAKTPFFYNRKKLMYPTTGLLSFEEMKEALTVLLKSNKTISHEEKLIINLEFIHRYNDAFRDWPYKDKQRSENDKQLFLESISSLIPLLDANKVNDSYLIAEFLRESGEFEECIKVLHDFKTVRPHLRDMAALVEQRALNKDDGLFEIF